MSANYTPGPWDARELFDDGDDAQSLGLFISATAQRNPVATLPGIGREDFANAQLIAAAPDLLAALEFVARDLNTDMPAETAAIVQFAINKAKGNQS